MRQDEGGRAPPKRSLEQRTVRDAVRRRRATKDHLIAEECSGAVEIDDKQGLLIKRSKA